MKTPTVEQLFEGRPKARELFDVVQKFMLGLEGVTMEIAKTQVGFKAATKFAWVWLPQLWVKNRPEESITVSFDHGAPLKSKRLAEVAEARPGRWVHHVVLAKKGDFDAELQGWLREARVFGGQRNTPSVKYQAQLKREGFKHIYEWKDKAGTVYEVHKHKDKVAFYILRGDLEMVVAGKKHHLAKGDRFDVPVGVEHAATVGPKGCAYVVGEMIEGDS